MLLPSRRSSSSSCTPPPATFTPLTSDAICSVRYCFPTKSSTFKWSNNTGEVTRDEVESAMGVIWDSKAVPTLAGQGNVLAYGHDALAAMGANWLFEITGDLRALDLMVRFSDNVLALRNSNTTGMTIWTGKKNLVWPTSSDGFPNSEQGAYVANMLNAAVQILKTPCVYNLIPPPNPGFPTPSSFSASTTYLEKARTYIQAGDDTYNDYFIPQFFDEKNFLIQPDDPKWNPGNVQASANAAGVSMPWNRRMMVISGLINLARAHEFLPNPDISRISLLDNLTQVNIADFIAALRPSTEKNGLPTYVWSYVKTNVRYIEEAAKGIHGWFDVLGLFLAWQRNAGKFGITDEIMTTLANTMENTINLGGNSFAGTVDGKSTGAAPNAPSLHGVWGFYGKWLPKWFDTISTAADSAGMGSQHIQLLWVKHALAQNSATFWTSGSSPNQPGTASPNSPTSGTTSPQIPPAQPSSGSTFSPTTTYDDFWIWSLVLLIVVLLVLAAMYFWRRQRKEDERKRDQESETTERKGKRERKNFLRRESDSDRESSESGTGSSSTGSNSSDSNSSTDESDSGSSTSSSLEKGHSRKRRRRERRKV